MSGTPTRHAAAARVGRSRGPGNRSVVLGSAFTGRRVVGVSDCLWGLIDGMNDAGLAASLAFGGRRAVGPLAEVG
jgi:hypothetical protein